jgi:hypothetical protein
VSAPYLEVEDPIRARFDAWVAGAIGRHSPPLEFREVRKGVQALSTLWVEGRHEPGALRRATQGAGKRAAIATYFAPLHFLATWHALGDAGPDAAGKPARVIDLGCGSGPVGAALACACGRPPVEGVDPSAWALAEARHTYAAFGLAGRTRRAALPAALPRVRPGDLLALGWVVNELDAAVREALLEGLLGAAREGAGLFVAEPLSARTSPWWKAWATALARAGAREGLARGEFERPARIAELDRASGLDHRVIGARYLVRAPGAR